LRGSPAEFRKRSARSRRSWGSGELTRGVSCADASLGPPTLDGGRMIHHNQDFEKAGEKRKDKANENFRMAG
jgi:hypothetical protein